MRSTGFYFMFVEMNYKKEGKWGGEEGGREGEKEKEKRKRRGGGVERIKKESINKFYWPSICSLIV